MTLTLDQVKVIGASNSMVPPRVTKKSPSKMELKTVKSSPMLQGAWVDRNTFIAISTPEKKGEHLYLESYTINNYVNINISAFSN